MQHGTGTLKVARQRRPAPVGAPKTLWLVQIWMVGAVGCGISGAVTDRIRIGGNVIVGNGTLGLSPRNAMKNIKCGNYFCFEQNHLHAAEHGHYADTPGFFAGLGFVSG